MLLAGDVVSVCRQPIKLLFSLFARTNSPSGKQTLIDSCVTITGILITAYSSLGSPDRPGCGEADPVLMAEPLVKEIAAKRNCSPAQVCLLNLKRGGPV